MSRVYIVSGPNSKFVYVGYCVDDDQSALDHFLVGTRRSEDRGDIRFVEEHGGAATALTATVVSVHDTELEAHFERNRLRGITPFAFTGPTPLPTAVHERAKAENPTRVAQAYAAWAARQQQTARKAYEMGLWTFQQIAAVAKVCGRDQVGYDLDRLSPDEFHVKYKLNS